MSYRVHLDVFEGPLDLLLHLIQKHELDIYDIPVALITQQYLEYLNLMQSLDMEIAGEFLVMASTLTQIKSRMLLPRPEDEADEAGVDPRAALVQRLLEYKKFKDAALSLEQKEALWSQVFSRPPDTTPDVSREEEPMLFDFHLFDLLSALKDVLSRVPEGQFEITAESVSITDKISLILGKLEEAESVLFADLFAESTSRLQIVATFLALLELMKTRVVKAIQIEPFGAIRLMKAVSESPEG